jgi:T5SS/PEP-CTERM-associated repeat protein
MKTGFLPTLARTLTLIALGLALTTTAMGLGPPNSWIDGNGKWENSNNWSRALAPSTSDGYDNITNAGIHTVTIDSVTPSGALTINNLIVGTNTLSLTGGSVLLTVNDQLDLSNNSTVFENGSELDVGGNLSVGGFGSGNQLVVTNGGTLYNYNGGAVIGGVASSNNSVVVTGLGFWEIDFGSLNVQNSGPGIAIKIAGGGAFFDMAPTNVFIGNGATADGNVVVVTDPTSSWENDGILNVGGAGFGAQFIVSNGASAFSAGVVIGDPVGHGHSGVLTGTGSTWTVVGAVQIGNGGTNDSLTISDAGALAAAQVQVTGATLILNGGTFSTPSLVLTNGGAQPTAVLLTGGSAFVTNATGTGQLKLFNGSLILSNGATLVADTLTNVSATFTNLGGTFILKSQATVNQGTATFSSGTNQFGSTFAVGSTANSTGVVNITGGTLTVTNGVFAAGNDGTLFGTGGVAHVTVSSGLVDAVSILIGDSFGNDSSFAVSGDGHVRVHGGLRSNGIKTTTINGGTLEIVDGPPPPFEDPALNDRIVVSYLGDGRMIVSNGTVLGLEMVVGLASGEGTLEMAGGSVNLSSNLLVGMTSTATGVVTITGGSISVTNGVFGVGNDGTAGGTGGVAHVTVSDGLLDAASILVGDTAGSDCSLTVTGTGYVRSHGGLRSNGIKTTVVNGGTLEVVDGPPQPFEDPILFDRIVVSYLADGKMIVSNGTARTPGMLVGTSAGNTGTLELAGGTTSVFSNMTVGFVACTATGLVTVTGGNLFVTNTTGTAVLEVRSGAFTVSSGFVQVDKLVVTNPCARLVHTGGTLLYGQLVLDPHLSAAGDGIPNGWKQQYNLDPFDPNLGNESATGTGFSNLQEYLAGFNPTNPAAYPHIISLARTNTTDVQVIYLGANGDSTYVPGIASRTNVLEFTTGTADGSYSTNNFASTGQTNILSGGTGFGVVTNMIDSGGGTNTPSRYYRVRVLVP